MEGPLFAACLICEDVRHELRNRTSFMGVYGLAPVDITADSFPAVLRMYFVFFSPQRKQAVHKLGFRIEAEGDTAPVFEAPESQFETSEDRRTNLSLGIESVVFEKPG